MVTNFLTERISFHHLSLFLSNKNEPVPDTGRTNDHAVFFWIKSIIHLHLSLYCQKSRLLNVDELTL